MNWTSLWLHLFGTTQLLGIDMGFWAAMALILVIAVLMNLVFWGIKPRCTDGAKSPTAKQQT